MKCVALVTEVIARMYRRVPIHTSDLYRYREYDIYVYRESTCHKKILCACRVYRGFLQYNTGEV